MVSTFAAGHAIPLALFASVGHAVEVPSQASATSHSPPATRQTKPLALKVLPGQVAVVALQVSATSQAPPLARQIVVADANPLPGQAVPVPLQVSATSQTPAAARHTVPAAHRAHDPAAHCPVVPHVDWAWTAQRRCGSAPLLTLLHVPVVPARLQA